MRESNSRQRFWRPLSYHLTNPLSSRHVAEHLTIILVMLPFVKKNFRENEGVRFATCFANYFVMPLIMGRQGEFPTMSRRFWRRNIKQKVKAFGNCRI